LMIPSASGVCFLEEITPRGIPRGVVPQPHAIFTHQGETPTRTGTVPEKAVSSLERTGNPYAHGHSSKLDTTGERGQNMAHGGTSCM
jgi:hypothetical protein